MFGFSSAAKCMFEFSILAKCMIDLQRFAMCDFSILAKYMFDFYAKRKCGRTSSNNANYHCAYMCHYPTRSRRAAAFANKAYFLKVVRGACIFSGGLAEQQGRYVAEQQGHPLCGLGRASVFLFFAAGKGLAEKPKSPFRS